MTQEQENSIYESYMVLVQKQKISDKSKCPVKGCESLQTYTIFVGTNCKLSTLYETSCGKHLAHQVNKAIKYRGERINKRIEQYKKNEREAAEKLLSNNY